MTEEIQKYINTKRGAKTIIEILKNNPERYGELQQKAKLHGGTLGTRLKEMVAMGIIERVDYRKIPPHVEYQLTEKGLLISEELKFD